MENKIFSMGDCFSVEEVRKSLIKKLKEKGISDEEIKKIIIMCDEMYNEHKVPYPTAEEIILNDKKLSEEEKYVD